jgi:hypothetical protein
LPIVTIETLIGAARALFQATNAAEKNTHEALKEREALLSQLYILSFLKFLLQFN